VPAPLILPFGKLFFGFKVAAYTPPPAPTSPGSPGVSAPVSQASFYSHSISTKLTVQPAAFGGSGNTLSGRSVRSQPQASPSSSKGKGKEKAATEDSNEDAKWGTGGQPLGSRIHVPLSFRTREIGAGGAPVPLSRRKGKEKEPAKKAKSPSPEHDWGVDDDDVIVIDSD
jgi:ubiquitin fusion degradation protein 1